MKVYAEYDELPIPTYALSYLVNGDSSGIEESDVKVIDAYMSDYYNEAKEVDGHVIFSCDTEGDTYFTWNPEFGLACEVEDCTIVILVEGEEEELPDMSCNQCEALMINGIYCHETGCPNANKVKVDGEWVTPEDDNEDDYIDLDAEDYDD